MPERYQARQPCVVVRKWWSRRSRDRRGSPRTDRSRPGRTRPLGRLVRI